MISWKHKLKHTYSSSLHVLISIRVEPKAVLIGIIHNYTIIHISNITPFLWCIEILNPVSLLTLSILWNPAAYFSFLFFFDICSSKIFSWKLNFVRYTYVYVRAYVFCRILLFLFLMCFFYCAGQCQLRIAYVFSLRARKLTRALMMTTLTMMMMMAIYNECMHKKYCLKNTFQHFFEVFFSMIEKKWELKQNKMKEDINKTFFPPYNFWVHSHLTSFFIFDGNDRKNRLDQRCTWMITCQPFQRLIMFPTFFCGLRSKNHWKKESNCCAMNENEQTELSWWE